LFSARNQTFCETFAAQNSQKNCPRLAKLSRGRLNEQFEHFKQFEHL